MHGVGYAMVRAGVRRVAGGVVRGEPRPADGRDGRVSAPLELCVLGAVHRHLDPAPTPPELPVLRCGVDEEEVVAMLTQLLAMAVAP